MGTRAGWLAAAAAALMVLSGCSTEQPDLQDPSPPSASTTVSVAPSSPSESGAPSTSEQSSTEVSTSRSEQSSSAPIDQETTDRASVEQAWTSYWVANEKLAAVPINERPARLEPYAVDPILTMALDKAEEWAQQGQIGYGVPVSHISWEAPIAGADTAVMNDCVDGSGVGTQNAATGELLTKGLAAELTKVTALRGADGVWRISRIEYMTGAECTQ